MKLVRYLEEVTLMKAKKEKQPNGTYINTYEEVENYQVQKNTLNDEVSATVYGSNVVKMLAIGTPLHNLEAFLQQKVSNKEDNISLYFIKANNTMYKINSVTENSIMLERL